MRFANLSEAELEFLYEHGFRYGNRVNSHYQFRVRLDAPEWPIALRLVERGLLSEPQWCGTATARRFYWKEEGREVISQYFAYLRSDALRELPIPTDAMPGSRAKLEELRTRATLGLELWSTDDAQPRCMEAESVWQTQR